LRRLARTTGLRLSPVLVAVALLATSGAGATVALTGLDAPAAAPPAAAGGLVLAPPADQPVAAAADVPVSPVPAAPSPAASAAPAKASAPAPRAPAAGPQPTVAPLKALLVPDLMVEVPGGLTAAQLQALGRLRGVTGTTVLDLGTAKLAGGTARVAGVDPSTFRAFTPKETASSDALWASVARGELAPSYALLRKRNLGLGKDATVTAARPVRKRIGAVAAYAVPGVDLVVDRAVAAGLGVRPSTAVLITAPKRKITALRKAVRRVAPGAEVTVLRAEAVQAASVAGKPRTYRELYIQSARYCSGLSWTILAAIGQIESGHGRNMGPSSAGALGPMQFMPATWQWAGVDGDRDGDTDVMDPFDAVPSAALYLCRHGANRGSEGLYDAIFAYNHADWYVQKVLGLAAKYR
jgi:hypothetical protein